jgi:antitoxin VapB
MALNIKNREAHLMAEELSKLTGESMTTAVTVALREVVNSRASASPIDFWRSAKTAVRA